MEKQVENIKFSFKTDANLGIIYQTRFVEGIMGYLLGLQEYLNERYEHSIFDDVLDSKQPWQFHIHGHRVITARVLENMTYDLRLAVEDQGEEVLPKIQVKFLYPIEMAALLKSQTKEDEKIMALGLEPITSRQNRFYVKNKSLYPLMKEKQVVFFILLEGEIIRGVISDFSRYDVTVKLKGAIPVTILRHSIYDLRNKKGRCYLKSFQEEHRDWEKTSLYIS